MIQQKKLYYYFRNNLDWCCPAGPTSRCVHNFFKEFEITFKSKWMIYYKRNIFRKRLDVEYLKELNHLLDHYYFEMFKPILRYFKQKNIVF